MSNFFSNKLLKEKQGRYNNRIPEKFPIRETGARVAIIGKPGCGKSVKWSQQVVMNGGAFHKAFHRCWFIAPQSSVDSVEGHPFADHCRTITDLSTEILESIMDDCRQNKNDVIQRERWEIREALRKKEKREKPKKKRIDFDNEELKDEEEDPDPEPPKAILHQNLLIIDDMGVALKDHGIQRSLIKLFSTSRHLSLTVLLIVQSYMMIPLTLRKLLSHACFYKNMSIREKNSVNDEFLGLSRGEQQRFFDFMLEKNDIPYCTCILNRESGKVYRDFEEIGPEMLNSL